MGSARPRTSYGTFLLLARRETREWGRILLRWLAPPACILCKIDPGSDEVLCGPCLAALRPRAGAPCRLCGEPLPPPRACPGCRTRRPGLHWARAPFIYRGTGGALVRSLKFRHNTAAGIFLVDRMARHLLTTDPPALSAHVLVPIPVHRSRRRKRGFDQSVWLAELLAQRLRLPLYARALTRVRATLPQGDPRTVSRRRNVQGAFAPGRGLPPAGARVLLVDDVTTSGETAAECSRVLAAAGARSVSLITACRARVGAPIRA